jgi:hypothetical protein
METDILAILFNPLRLLLIALVLAIFSYLLFVENKYEKALKNLKNDPDNHDLYVAVMRIGREHMQYKRQQHVGQMSTIHPDTPREELVEESYHLYNDKQIKEDIYRVVGRTYN